MIETSSQLTPRESVMMEYEKEENRLGREFALAMKDREITLATLEAKWSAWLRIPMTIIKLPLLTIWALVLGTAYIVSVFRKQPIDITEWWKHLS